MVATTDGAKTWDVIGLGNALVDALVVMEDDALIEAQGLKRGTMHLVDHDRWTELYESVQDHPVTFESGGSCANTIAAIGLLGGRSLYRGQVGDDPMGRTYAQRLEEACGGHALHFTKSHPTGKCLSIISGPDAERTMLTDLGASTALDFLGPLADAIRGCKVAHFTGYTLLDGAIREPTIDAMRLARNAGAKVSLDAADPFVVMQIRDLLWTLLSEYVDIVFLNADEAEGLTGKTAEEAAEEVATRGKVQTVVVKLGSRGSIVYHDGQAHKVDIFRVDAKDTTGAGDAYAGGFLYGLVSDWPLHACGELGSRVAALAVAQVGAVVKDRNLLQRAATDVRARL